MERKCDAPDSYSRPLALVEAENTEIHILRMRRLNLESFMTLRLGFYTTLPFQNLMSFQRHLLAHNQLRPHYSGPFYLWRSIDLPLPSSYCTQTSYLIAISLSRPCPCHTVTETSNVPYLEGQILIECVPGGGRWQLIWCVFHVWLKFGVTN